MLIEIIQAGTLTTVQDLGRFNVAHLGIPQSGCLDSQAAVLANQMVGNEADQAVLEVTWQGIEFICAADCSIAIAGAEYSCFVDDTEVNTDQTIQLQQGSRFKMGHLQCGLRAYVAFAGGFNLPSDAGSQSTLLTAGFGGFKGRALKSGDSLPLQAPRLNKITTKPYWKKLRHTAFHVIRAMPGPEVSLFNQQAIAQAYGQAYELNQSSNRQGFRLTSKSIFIEPTISVNSSGLVPGSLQVTPDGQSILAMHDAQTTGGYPRILVVHKNELSKLAQIRTGEKIYFFVER